MSGNDGQETGSTISRTGCYRVCFILSTLNYVIHRTDVSLTRTVASVDKLTANVHVQRSLAERNGTVGVSVSVSGISWNSKQFRLLYCSKASISSESTLLSSRAVCFHSMAITVA